MLHANQRLHVEDNKGGDFLTLTVEHVGGDGVDLRMEVGHQCVGLRPVTVPAAFLVMCIVDALDTHGGVEKAIRALGEKFGWTGDVGDRYVQSLVARVKE